MMRLDLLGMMFIQEKLDYMLFREKCYIQMMSANNFIEVKVIGIRPAIVSTLYDSNMQKAPVIHRATLLYIFFNSLKYQS